MYISRLINVVDSHTGGEPTRVITGGVADLPGQTMAEKMSFLKDNMDWLRTTLMQEPRGHRDMFGALLTPPTSAEADSGIIFMNTGGYLNMCGHGSIGAVTVLLETGILPAQEPLTRLTLDTPSGLVRMEAKVEMGRVTAVNLLNVPSFLYQENLPLEVPGFGSLSCDIAYGGNFFALVPAAALGLKVCGQNATSLVSAGMRIMTAVNEKYKPVHPEQPHINQVDLVEIHEKRSRLHAVNAVIFGDGALDRSPCGTGTSAKLAALHAGGELKVGEEYINESPIGSIMKGRIIKETMVAGLPAIVPEISARAFITGISQLVIDPEDPFKHGFQLN